MALSTTSFSVKLSVFSVLFLVIAGVWAVNETVVGSGKSEYQLRVIHPNGVETVLDLGAPRAEGDDPVATPAPLVNSTNNATLECESAGTCCYQFTWPGANRNQDYGYNCNSPDAKSSTEPCKEPMVFTKDNRTQGNSGRRPDIDELLLECTKRPCKIYCSGGGTCIKYSFYQNDRNGLKLWNETKFCGQVNSLNSGKVVSNGCYQEKLSNGYTKEVCVCNRPLCNSSNPSSPSRILLVVLSAFLLLPLFHKSYAYCS